MNRLKWFGLVVKRAESETVDAAMRLNMWNECGKEDATEKETVGL